MALEFPHSESVQIWDVIVYNRQSFIILLSLLFAFPGFPQKGTAPNGYYPNSYDGSIFTGAVESTDGGLLTLLYTKGKKQQHFMGRLDAPCLWTDKVGTTHSIEVRSIPVGDELTVFYLEFPLHSKGQAPNENTIIAIRYAQHSGQKIPEDKRVTVWCSRQTHLQFKAF